VTQSDPKLVNGRGGCANFEMKKGGPFALTMTMFASGRGTTYSKLNRPKKRAWPSSATFQRSFGLKCSTVTASHVRCAAFPPERPTRIQVARFGFTLATSLTRALAERTSSLTSAHSARPAIKARRTSRPRSPPRYGCCHRLGDRRSVTSERCTSGFSESSEMVPDRPGSVRSANMRAVRSKNTKPEIIVRKVAHRLGYRFRLHRRDLPGHPDLVFAARRKVIFVHGCFWHVHTGCKRATSPKANAAFWRAKLDRNVQRDADQLAALQDAGWEALVVWECETKNQHQLSATIRSFLG